MEFTVLHFVKILSGQPLPRKVVGSWEFFRKKFSEKLLMFFKITKNISYIFSCTSALKPAVCSMLPNEVLCQLLLEEQGTSEGFECFYNDYRWV